MVIFRPLVCGEGFCGRFQRFAITAGGSANQGNEEITSSHCSDTCATPRES
jgi:hypothetical protein